jgi:hypothetical protein
LFGGWKFDTMKITNLNTAKKQTPDLISEKAESIPNNKSDKPTGKWSWYIVLMNSIL